MQHVFRFKTLSFFLSLFENIFKILIHNILVRKIVRKNITAVLKIDLQNKNYIDIFHC